MFKYCFLFTSCHILFILHSFCFIWNLHIVILSLVLTERLLNCMPIKCVCVEAFLFSLWSLVNAIHKLFDLKHICEQSLLCQLQFCWTDFSQIILLLLFFTNSQEFCHRHYTILSDLTVAHLLLLLMFHSLLLISLLKFAQIQKKIINKIVW